MKSKFLILIISIVFFMLFWFQMTFMSGIHPFSIYSFQLFLIPFLLILLGYLSKWLIDKFVKFQNNIVARQFTIGALVILLLSAISRVVYSNSTLDIQIHDTYFVIAHFHILILFALIMGFYAVIYFWTPKIINEKLNEGLGQVHFWASTIGVLFLIGQSLKLGRFGMPSRYYSFEVFDVSSQIANVNLVIIIIAILVIATQILFFANLVFSIFKSLK